MYANRRYSRVRKAERLSFLRTILRRDCLPSAVILPYTEIQSLQSHHYRRKYASNPTHQKVPIRPNNYQKQYDFSGWACLGITQSVTFIVQTAVHSHQACKYAFGFQYVHYGNVERTDVDLGSYGKD